MKTLMENVSQEDRVKFKNETIKLLETTREPRHAYVIIEIQKVRSERLEGDKKFTIRLGSGIQIVNVEEQPDQWYIINDSVMNRKGKVVCWGNFPTAADPDPSRAKKYRNHNNPENNTNSYDVLAGKLANLTGNDREIYAELSEYKKKVLELQKENKELKKDENLTTANDGVGDKKAAPGK